MSHLHPGVQLLLLSGLVIFWLIPLSSWLMLSGQRDHNANLWFAGTGVYALVATLFVFQSHLPSLVTGPITGTLAVISVLTMFEALRREVSPRNSPVLRYAGLVGLLLLVLSTLHALHLYAQLGRALQMLAISAVELALLWMTNRVRLQHRSKSLWVVMAMFGAYVLSNLSRVAELLLTGRFSLLLDFTPVASSALLVNYLSVIFYCYGYWGFVVEKNRHRLVTATEEMVMARENEKNAREREMLARQILQERTEMMERIASIGKLAQSGALSATIAHEINQPLTAIQLNVEEAQRMAHEDAADRGLRHLLENIERDNLRAASIVRRIRGMFGQRQIHLECLNLHDLVHFVLDCMQQRLRQERVQVELAVPEDTTLFFTPGEMEHVLMNLLENALDALVKVPEHMRRIEMRSWREPGWLWIAVSDNGQGIPISRRDTVFSLSESGKPQGMGVGLWLTRYIVERHAGKVMIDPDHGPGACFLLQLPDVQRT